MVRQLRIVLATLAALIILDATVALVLIRAPASLRNFFDYGRSVPGKLSQWQADPTKPGNLLKVAWLPELIAISRRDFSAEDPAAGPILRVYGMSFTNQMVDAIRKIDPSLRSDSHAGPSAPPNFVYAAFLDDRAYRRQGDVVLFGILSKSVPAVASFSNRVWAFEQPAAFTYPLFRPDAGDALTRVDPAMVSFDDFGDPEKSAAFDRQLREQDGLWTAAAFDIPWLDASPLARLLRRALATSAIDRQEAKVLAHPEEGSRPWLEILRRMVREVARIANEDGQVPVVMLIQSRDADAVPLLATLGPLLQAEGIPYLATEEVASPSDGGAYLGDGHFTPVVNDRLAEKFLSLPVVQGLFR